MFLIILLCFVIIIFLLRYNFFRLPKKGIIILLYHSVSSQKSNTSLDKFNISLEKFEKQIKFLKKLGYSAIKASETEHILQNKLYNKKKFILVTFDDGYKNNLEAAKILNKHGFSALFFISSAYIGKTLDNMPMLDENNIKLLIELGMEIGSHSHFHLKLSELSKNEILENVTRSKEILSQFTNVEDFAYPFGNYSQDVIEVLKKSGFKRAYIIGQSINTTKYNPYVLRRSIIRSSTNYLDLYLILTRGRSRI
ncbi:polysaccharide deacetylase family protein [Desulfurella sp.]|uniref:polysaccharide deacetylase family protein n=1 Tax=Desulfurella sp. TaxID=1962857 RepID=UPI003D107AB2